MVKRVTFDFETRSKVNLKKTGAFKYSLDSSSQPTCLSFKILGEPRVYFLDFEMVNRPWRDLPPELQALWRRLVHQKYEFSAHNAFFELCIYKNILVKRLDWPDISFRQFRCTAAKAAACALPRALGDAGAALRLSIQKDPRGHAAMMATCKPTRAWKAWEKLQEKVASGARITEKSRLKALEPEPEVFLEPEAAPETWKTLYTYCKIDTRAEELLDQTLPDLIPSEQEIWFLNQKLNWRGLRVDVPTIEKITGIMDIENKKKVKELDKLTMGLVTKPGARKSILEFLALDGIELPDIRAKTVKDSLEGFALTEDARRLLEIRKALSMTSTKKYYAFQNRANSDGRIRDILLYHGASTGRDTGSGIQPHNFPRGLIKADKARPYATVENVVQCDYEMLRLLYGESLPIVFSALLRNMIIPSSGKELFVADFSRIELAVLWWLADHTEGLALLAEGKDPYKRMAAYTFKKEYEDIEDEGEERQLGKAQELGAGFGMGWPKFQTTAWDVYRLKLTSAQARHAIKTYREVNAPVPALWKTYEAAAIQAVKFGKPVEAGKCTFFTRDKFLWIELPSGRRLAYRDPQISWRVREYEEITEHVVDGKIIETRTKKWTQPTETLEFWAVNSKTKKWDLERSWGGTTTENIVQATARDLMMPAMVRLEKKGYEALLMVHDEGICEKDKGTGSLKEFIEILCQRPPWADGLPVEAKGWIGPRYRK